MKVISWLVAALIAVPATGALAQYSRDQQNAACSGDAFRLCSEFIPDEARIEACMSAKKESLSESCRVVFDGSEATPVKRRRSGG